MSGRWWRRVALGLWFYHVIGTGIPWCIDHLGLTWGVIAATVYGVGASLVIAVPLRDPGLVTSAVDPAGHVDG